MKIMSFTEFRQRASETLDLVEQGETVRILRHGRPVATIVPVESRADQPSWKRPALGLPVRGVSLSGTILRERGESP